MTTLDRYAGPIPVVRARSRLGFGRQDRPFFIAFNLLTLFMYQRLRSSTRAISRLGDEMLDDPACPEQLPRDCG